MTNRPELADDPLIDNVVTGIMKLQGGVADSVLMSDSERLGEEDVTRTIATPRANEQLEIIHSDMEVFIKLTTEELISRRDQSIARISPLPPSNSYPTLPTEADHIRIAAGKPDRLEALINGGTFTTGAARLAATMQFEFDLINEHRGNLKALMGDVEKHRIKSVQGLKAHGAAIDRELLDLYVGNPTGMRGAIENKVFNTEVGRKAAETQHDYDMLADAVDDVSMLRERVIHREGLFFVDAMAEAAAARHDELLLEIHREYPRVLRKDIANDSFFTKEGKAAALGALSSNNP